MTKINITNKAEINAKGSSTHGCRKPVINLTTGDVYASQVDAARELGVHRSVISAACLGRVNTVKGYQFCMLNKANENLGRLMAELHEAKEKAAKYDAIMAEQLAAEREAEEKRKAAALHQRKVEKARADIERRRRVLENNERRVTEAQQRLTQAVAMLQALENTAVVA